MKTKSKYFSALLWAGMILGGCIAIPHPCFSEDDQSTDTQVPYKQPTSDFKQLTNQELIEASLAITPPEYRKHFSRDEVLKREQFFYNIYLNMILGYFNLVDPKIQDQLDRSSFEKLAWVIETDKKTYRVGEPVYIRLSLKNISEDEVLIYNPVLGRYFLLQSISLKKYVGTEKTRVYLTRGGYEEYLHPDIFSLRKTESILLKPGERTLVYHTFLNPFYDLTYGREYELTFYTRNFLGSDDEQIGEYPKPCTIHFEIHYYTDLNYSQVVWPEEEK